MVNQHAIKSYTVRSSRWSYNVDLLSGHLHVESFFPSQTGVSCFFWLIYEL